MLILFCDVYTPAMKLMRMFMIKPNYFEFSFLTLSIVYGDVVIMFFVRPSVQ